MAIRSAFLLVCFSAVLFLAGTACVQSTEVRNPIIVRTVHLHGTHYEMGLQHGRLLSGDMKHLYTRFLTMSVLPYMSREQPFISGFFPYYLDERFLHGNFGFEILKEAAFSLETYLPETYRDELRGISDGSGMSYSETLILNTFLDSLLCVLNIRAALGVIQSPWIGRVVFSDRITRDGIDNDEDGTVDEWDENVLQPLRYSRYGTMKEIPPRSTLEFTLRDYSLSLKRLGDGILMDTLRIEINSVLYMRGSEGWWDDRCEKMPTIRITPPGGFPASQPVSVVIVAGDQQWTYDPPPAKTNVSREHTFTFSTQGAGLDLRDIPNAEIPDKLGNADSVSFAAHGDATKSGELIVGRHFALLDIDLAHKFAYIIVYHPRDKETGELLHKCATLSWSGISWAITGMNDSGLVVGLSRSDTLNDSAVGNMTKLRILPEGFPIGMLMRHILENFDNLDDAGLYLQSVKPVNGWSILLADGKTRDIRVAEIVPDILCEGVGYDVYTPDTKLPENRDPWGRAYASVTPYDIRSSNLFMKKLDDFPGVPQIEWSGGVFSGLRSHHYTGKILESYIGRLDPIAAIEVLRSPALVHERDSMHSGVLLPESLSMFVALGERPATAGGFQYFSREDLFPEIAE